MRRAGNAKHTDIDPHERARLLEIIAHHLKHGVLSLHESSALLESSDAEWVSDELIRFEMRWLVEVLDLDSACPGGAS